jgi:hypothetical protein
LLQCILFLQFIHIYFIKNRLNLFSHDNPLPCMFSNPICLWRWKQFGKSVASTIVYNLKNTTIYLPKDYFLEPFPPNHQITPNYETWLHTCMATSIFFFFKCGSSRVMKYLTISISLVTVSFLLMDTCHRHVVWQSKISWLRIVKLKRMKSN